MVAMVSMGANAQSRNDRFGVKLGPTIDWAGSGSSVVKNDGVRMGFNVGLVYDHCFSKHLMVSSGVNLNFLRMKYTFADHRQVNDFLGEATVMVSRKLKATNVEIPLKLKFRMDVGDIFTAYVEAGGGLGFNVKDMGKDNYEFFWVPYSDDDYVNYSSQYRLFQASMIIGLGAEYEINRNLTAFAQLTFDHAFSNAFIRVMEKQTGSIIHNNFIGIEVGVMH